MKMSWFEKILVNREKKGLQNFKRIRQCLDGLEITKVQDVLELGCGMGTVSAMLAKTYGMRVCGIDCDPEQIELARQTYPENQILCFGMEDAARLSFPASSFDLVVTQNVFHHLSDWRPAVREIERVLRPEGFFIWYDFATPAYLKHWLPKLTWGNELYTFEEMKLTIEASGLTSSWHTIDSHLIFAHHTLVSRKSRATSNAA